MHLQQLDGINILCEMADKIFSFRICDYKKKKWAIKCTFKIFDWNYFLWNKASRYNGTKFRVDVNTVFYSVTRCWRIWQYTNLHWHLSDIFPHIHFIQIPFLMASTAFVISIRFNNLFIVYSMHWIFSKIGWMLWVNFDMRCQWRPWD